MRAEKRGPNCMGSFWETAESQNDRSSRSNAGSSTALVRFPRYSGPEIVAAILTGKEF